MESSPIIKTLKTGRHINIVEIDVMVNGKHLTRQEALAVYDFFHDVFEGK